MGPKNNFSIPSNNYFHRLSKALEFAFSEWLLMFLLFIDACFTYLIAKFAAYCHLQTPCLLCTRYDHLLSKDKTGIYWDSICNHHKSDLSSVVLHHVHDKNLLPTSSIHDTSESLLTNGEHFKDEKNIFVDKSLESYKSSEKIQVDNYLEVEYRKVGVEESNNESELLVSDNGIHLKSGSQIEVHVPETVAVSDTEELKWQNDSNKDDMALMTQQIPFEEAPLSNITETPVDASLETIGLFADDPPKIDEVIKDPITETEDPITETEPSPTTNGHQISNYLDLGDAYKLAISTKARQLSGKFLDQKSFKESSTKVNEDLKILLSHRSTDNTNLISPKLSFNSDELSLSGIQFLQRRISLERNESNISLDGSIVSEIDGESVADRLKRQVEHDKKLMGALYKELEEERNASAVATNQAMAMITRLQEEKAELYTEALQYLRMMEEQVEYNSEALQKANDLIEEKINKFKIWRSCLEKHPKMLENESIIGYYCV